MPARLLAISDRRSLPGENLLPWFEALARAEIPAVLLREKDLPDAALYELLIQARSILPPPRLLLVSGRADLALAAGADGVHLPAQGVPVEAVRHRVGRRLIVGCSTHSVAEVCACAASGADYVTLGPLYATPSKMRYGPPLGLDALRAAAGLGIPVLALGGVTEASFPELAASGASGVAGIRFAERPETLVQLKNAADRCFPEVLVRGDLG